MLQVHAAADELGGDRRGGGHLPALAAVHGHRQVVLEEAAVAVPVVVGEDVAVANDGDAAPRRVLRLRDAKYVRPVGQPLVALQPTAAVHLRTGGQMRVQNEYQSSAPAALSLLTLMRRRAERYL